MSLIHCIYSSKATVHFHERDAAQLLMRARANNAALEITGMLLFVDGNFFQVLEGEEAAVDAVFQRICNDSRHGRVTQIIREPIFERDFPDWTMGFANVHLGDLNSRVGENDFFTSASCLEQLSAGRARKLLSAFRQGRWRADQTGLHRAHGRMS